MFCYNFMKLATNNITVQVKVICSNELNLFYGGEMFQRKTKLQESIALHLLSIVQQCCRVQTYLKVGKRKIRALSNAKFWPLF
jgi:hypothetical protein